jgi:hypothetical protein
MRPAVPALLALAALAACAAPPFGAVPSAPAVSTGALGYSPGQPPGARPVLAAYPRLPPSRGLPVAESTASGAEFALVTAVLADLQARSFAENREYCGYVGFARSGGLAATPPVAGSEASCPLPPVPAGFTLVASFHTHGTYSPWYASEWPTTQDMLTDASDGIDGYIATPGGRLWHVDSDTMTARQLCGRNCLPQDPAYVADDGPLRLVLTFRDLVAWEGG